MGVKVIESTAERIASFICTSLVLSSQNPSSKFVGLSCVFECFIEVLEHLIEKFTRVQYLQALYNLWWETGVSHWEPVIQVCLWIPLTHQYKNNPIQPKSHEPMFNISKQTIQPVLTQALHTKHKFNLARVLLLYAYKHSMEKYCNESWTRGMWSCFNKICVNALICQTDNNKSRLKVKYFIMKRLMLSVDKKFDIYI